MPIIHWNMMAFNLYIAWHFIDISLNSVTAVKKSRPPPKERPFDDQDDDGDAALLVRLVYFLFVCFPTTICKLGYIDWRL